MTPGVLILTDELRRRIEAEGVPHSPMNAVECSLVVNSAAHAPRVVEELEPGRNAFEVDEQYHRFSIDPLQQLKTERAAEKQGKKLLGFYHSHPDHPARPSEYDREHAWETFSYVIVSILSGKPADMTSWMLDPATKTFARQEIVAAAR